MLVTVALVALVAAAAYWELVVAEGVHLGPRVVALLYDLTARRYDKIKQFDAAYEEWFIGEPLAQALAHLPEPSVLDVATGTGRAPLTLLRQASFQGRVIGLDSSRLMLTQAAQNTRDLADRLTLVWLEATLLPFEDGAFDAVTCMEALEFMPDTRRALSELVRVLRPGGVLLVTNRVSSWARWIIGHTQSRPVLEALLKSLDLASVQTQTWQVEYDLVWAIKPGHAARLEAKPLLDILHCPQCSGRLAQVDHSIVCRACGRVSPITPDGVIELMRGVRR